MRRACQTAQAISSSLKDCTFEVLPTLYEVGGMYRAEKAGPGSPDYVKVPAQGMSKSVFKKEFPRLDVSRLPDNGTWDEGRGYEVFRISCD
jgi:hypothetical protein